MRKLLFALALVLLAASSAHAQLRQILTNNARQRFPSGALNPGGFTYPGTATWLGITSTNIAKNEVITDLASLESAYSTVTLGRYAGQQLNKEADSVYIGNQAGQQMLSQGYYETGTFTNVGNGFHNTVIGAYAMGQASNLGCSADSGMGSFVVAIGAYSLYQMGCSGNGFDTTAVGDHSGANVTTGTGETIIGGDTGGPTTGTFLDTIRRLENVRAVWMEFGKDDNLEAWSPRVGQHHADDWRFQHPDWYECGR